jgi:putative transcriptional regulator
MVKFNLSRLLGERRIQQTELSKKTGIRKATIFSYYHGYAKRLNVDDINKICNTLDCRLDELIEFIPDKK